MTEFNEKQIKVLKGSFTRIAQRVGCTREYVADVLYGIAGNKRGGEKAAAIREKSKELLDILMPADK